MDAGDERKEMIAELQQLRRGQGLLSTDLMERVGPRLRSACALDQQSSVQDRRLLTERIIAELTHLPPDLATAVRAAFALAPASQARFLRERMSWLGDALERDPRTAMRRVESGLTLLAERLLGEHADPAEQGTGTGTGEPPARERSDAQPTRESAYAPDGWYVDSFRATLMMHVDPVQLLETRSVVSTLDGLDRLVISWSIPSSSQATPMVDMLYGGELVRDEATSTETFWSGHLFLPRPLKAGERHEFQVKVTSLPREEFRPYYVLTPFRRCDEFVLRAKFERSNGPDRIWCLDGVPFQLVHEAQAVGEIMDLDAVGEVVREFRDLQQGLSYGLRWYSAAAPSGPWPAEPS